MKRKLAVGALILAGLVAFALWWNEEYGWSGSILEGRPASSWIAELNDDDPATRMHAAEAMAVIPAHTPGVVPALVERLSDADAGVRAAALWALGEMPGRFLQMVILTVSIGVLVILLSRPIRKLMEGVR